ncbi:MAG: ACT domain-containing protein [Acidimicrobiia bacterium]|nr:ACT domain-containing protein [Acidimicrobiia bacterium]
MTEFTVHLSNRPGMLAALATLIARAGVNIDAMAAFGIDEEGIVRIVADDAEATRLTLRDAGVSFAERTVLTTHVSNKPGSLADLTNELARCRVNIEAMYLLHTTAEEQVFALAVDNYDRAEDALYGSETTRSAVS